MKIQLSFVLIVSALFLTSCYPNFHLKEEVKIEKLSFHVAYDEKIEADVIQKLEFNCDQFLAEYKEFNQSSIEIQRIKVKDSADVRIHIKKVIAPPRVAVIAGWTISLGVINLIAWKPQIGLYFWPLSILNQSTNTTVISYRLSPKFADFPKRDETTLFHTYRKWGKREEEKALHLQHFDSFLTEFFSYLNREYQKNQAK